MRSKCMWSAATFCILFLCSYPVTRAIAELGVPIVMENPLSTGGDFTTEVKWQTVPPRQYDVHTSTNLQEGNWTPLNQEPIPSVTQVGTWSVNSTNTAAFFRVRGRDQEAPTIVDRYPATNGLGVGKSAQLMVLLTDETGVDTNAFALMVNGVDRLTNGSPGVTITSNTFAYAPGTNRWADYGGNATITLAYGDILGNVATSQWTFTVELLPVITNELVHIQPPSGGSSSRARAMATDAARKHGVKFADALTIISIASNHVVFSYSGTTHGLFVGAILINHDPTTFFYRRVMDLTDDPEQHLVTVATSDTRLGEIVEDGSFSPEILLPTTGLQPALLATDTLTLGIPFQFEQEFTLPPYTNILDGTVALKITHTMNVVLSGNVRFSGTITDGEVTAMLGEFDLQKTLRLSPKIEVYRDILDWHSPSIPTPPISIPLGTTGGFIGPVPIWVSLDLELSIAADVKCTAAIVWQPTLVIQKTDKARVGWTVIEGLNCAYEEDTQAWIEGANGGYRLSAEIFGYVNGPKLSARLYSAVGLYVKTKLGPYLKAEYTIGDPQAQISVYGRIDANAGLTAWVGVDDANLPSLPLFTWKHLLWRGYWPEIYEQAPTFTLQPTDVTTTAGSLVTLEAGASGNPQPTYQWFQNGSAVPLATKPEFRFTADYQSAGNYYALSYNRLGTATSTSAHVSVDPVGSWAFSDDFNRADNNDVGNGWTEFGSTASVLLTGGALHIDDYPSNAGNTGIRRAISQSFTQVEFRYKIGQAGNGHNFIFSFNYNGVTYDNGGMAFWNDTQPIQANTWYTGLLVVDWGLKRVHEYLDGVYIRTVAMRLDYHDPYMGLNEIMTRSHGTADNVDIFFDYIRFR